MEIKEGCVIEILILINLFQRKWWLATFFIHSHRFKNILYVKKFSSKYFDKILRNKNSIRGCFFLSFFIFSEYEFIIKKKIILKLTFHWKLFFSLYIFSSLTYFIFTCYFFFLCYIFLNFFMLIKESFTLG